MEVSTFATRMSRLGTESAFEVLAKAKQLEAQGKDIIHLEIGQPDFPTPINIIEAAYKAMKDGHTGISRNCRTAYNRNAWGPHTP